MQCPTRGHRAKYLPLWAEPVPMVVPAMPSRACVKCVRQLEPARLEDSPRWRRFTDGAWTLASFKKLHLPFVPSGGFERTKGSKVPALAGFGIALARVKAIFAGFKFSDHGRNLWRMPGKIKKWKAPAVECLVCFVSWFPFCFLQTFHSPCTFRFH